MVCSKIVEIEHTPGQRRIDMAHDLSFEILLCLEFVERETLPEPACFRRDTRSQDFDFLLAVSRWCSRVMAWTDRNACLW
jgi:hypothetical protein